MSGCERGRAAQEIVAPLLPGLRPRKHDESCGMGVTRTGRLVVTHAYRRNASANEGRIGSFATRDRPVAPQQTSPSPSSHFPYLNMQNCSLLPSVWLAQLDSASDYGSGGCRFESCVR